MTEEKKVLSLAKTSLTVQSSLALAVLIILEALLPLYTALEIPPEVFDTLCGLLGATVAFGMRRAIVPILIICMPLGLMECGTSVCDKAKVTIGAHPALPTPAGVVKVTCDGELKAEIKAKSVPRVSCSAAAICCEGMDNIPLPEEMEE